VTREHAERRKKNCRTLDIKKFQFYILIFWVKKNYRKQCEFYRIMILNKRKLITKIR